VTITAPLDVGPQDAIDVRDDIVVIDDIQIIEDTPQAVSSTAVTTPVGEPLMPFLLLGMLSWVGILISAVILTF
jgi:hypothetical protein